MLVERATCRALFYFAAHTHAGRALHLFAARPPRAMTATVSRRQGGRVPTVPRQAIAPLPRLAVERLVLQRGTQGSPCVEPSSPATTVRAYADVPPTTSGWPDIRTEVRVTRHWVCGRIGLVSNGGGCCQDSLRRSGGTGERLRPAVRVVPQDNREAQKKKARPSRGTAP